MNRLLRMPSARPWLGTRFNLNLVGYQRPAGMKIMMRYSSTIGQKIEIKPENQKSSTEFDAELIHGKLLNSLQKDMGLAGWLPVQAATFQAIMDGNDVMVKARTGTGKTLAFLLPIAQRIITLNERTPSKVVKKWPKALILCPTRELARQIEVEASRLAGWMSTVCCHGGVSYTPQLEKLGRGVDLVIGTPGRVIDLIDNGSLSLSQLQILTLDESDYMLDIGFSADIEKIMDTIKTQRDQPAEDTINRHQTLLFSATQPPWIEKIVNQYLNPKKLIRMDLVGDTEQQGSTNIQYSAVPCSVHQQPQVLVDLLRVQTMKEQNSSTKTGCRTIIFTDTKKDVDRLASVVHQHIPTCGVLHGDITQTHRDHTIDAFRQGKISVLIATDVAARGLDVPNVDMVIQLGIPSRAEPFLHRSGRTGRAGKSGKCVLLFDVDEEADRLKQLQRQTRITFDMDPAPNSETIVDLSMQQCLQAATNLTPEVIRSLSSYSETLLKEMSPVDAVGSLLALAGNIQGIHGRSILTGSVDKKTIHIKPQHSSSHYNMQYKSVMELLKEKFEHPVVKQTRIINNWCKSSSHAHIFLDVPESYAESMVNALKENKYEASILTQVPNLLELCPKSTARNDSKYPQKRNSYQRSGSSRPSFHSQKSGFSERGGERGERRERGERFEQRGGERFDRREQRGGERFDRREHRGGGERRERSDHQQQRGGSYSQQRQQKPTSWKSSIV